MPAYRKFGIKFITKLGNSTGNNKISYSQSGFHAYDRNALEKLIGISENGMSASLELVHDISRQGFKVIEVPISCKYAKRFDTETSTEHPLTHGISLVMSVIRFVVEDRPITCLGLPGVCFLIKGTAFGLWMLNIYSTVHQIVTNLALAAFSFIIIGFFMISTAITLYTINRLAQKLGN